jgi:UDP-N-acetylglucosamine 2-epimerase (non-hydrolysing)
MSVMQASSVGVSWPNAYIATNCKRIMLIYGTRPEAVKMAPIIKALEVSPLFVPLVAVTGQHRSMLDQINELFAIQPDVDLDIHQPAQTLTDITARALTGLTPVLDRYEPDLVMVQGDTTTTFVASLAAFYAQIPVAHIEAGLRTNDRYAPFPEEINRRLTTRLASLHFAPTSSSRNNLRAEGVDAADIVVTGNSVIDALLWATGRHPEYGDHALDDLDSAANAVRPVLLVTAHRRESWGEPMRSIGRALARIARAFPDLIVVFPIHRNPIVREAILPEVEQLSNVRVVEPLHYGGFVRLMDRSTLILTDSGGVQEEGPSLGKPVLVMREETERPDAIYAGTARLVGTDQDTIVKAVVQLLTDPDAYSAMANAVNPYGDGRAAERVVAALAHFFALGPPAEPFVSAYGSCSTESAPKRTWVSSVYSPIAPLR